MLDWNTMSAALMNNWPVWLVTAVLIVAAVIDGWVLKVPNWVTFPMIVGGWLYYGLVGGWAGLGVSMLGTIVGLALLMPAYAIGGMGAGDVKLLAGVGAWVGASDTFYAFCLSAVVGGVIAIGMVVFAGGWQKHKAQFFHILSEFVAVRDPNKLSEIAAERKPRMMLLPYGIPIAIGSIAWFAMSGMLTG